MRDSKGRGAGFRRRVPFCPMLSFLSCKGGGSGLLLAFSLCYNNAY